MAASVPPPLVALVAVLALLAGRTSAVSSARTGEEAVSVLTTNEDVVVTVTADEPTIDAEVVGSSATNATTDPADEAEVLTDDDRSDNLAALLTRRKAGCTYGGQLYAPGESIKSTEPCLNCTCHPVSLSITCHLRVCPTYPVPPPAGCFLVTRNGRCCSELICDHDINSVRRDQRRDDVPVTDADVSELTAELAAESLPHGSDGSCTVAGTVYADGSAMLTSSRCQYCFCIRGRQRCVQPKCTLREAGCRPRYRALDTCCPTDYDCQSITTTTTTTTTTTQKPSRDCTSGGRRYKEGSRIVDLTRPCRSCFCLRGHVRCAPVQCSPALEGCAPITEPGKCCPVSYNCSAGLPEKGLVARTTLDKELIEDEAEDEDVTAIQMEDESDEAGRPVSFARSANPPPAEVAVGVGSVVPIDYGSVIPVAHGSVFPVDSARTGPPQLPAASVSFRLHVKSDPLVVSKWDRRRVQENGAGLLTVRDLVLSGNEIASRRRSVDVPLRVEEASHDPEEHPEQVAPSAEIEKQSAPAEEQSAVSGEIEAEPNTAADLLDSEEGSGDASGADISPLMDAHEEPLQPSAEAASHSPVLMTGAFAGFSGQAIPILHEGQAIPILADSEDEQRIEDALAAVEENVEGSGQPHPELTVTNIFRAVLSEIEESRQQASQEIVEDVPADTPGVEPLPEPEPAAVESQAQTQEVVEQQVAGDSEDIADESDEIIPVTVGSAADFVSMLADDALVSDSMADDDTLPTSSEVKGESDVESSGLGMDETVKDTSTTTDEMIQTADAMVKELAMMQTKEENKIISEKLASESEKEAQAMPSEENDKTSQEVHKTMMDEASDSKTQAEPEPSSEPKSEQESEPVSEPGAEIESEPEPEVEQKSEPESKPESELDSESEPEFASEPVPESESKSESTSEASPEPEAEPVAEPESQPDSTSEPAPEPASDEISEPGSEPEPASEPIPEPESEPESASELEPASESRTEIVADPKPGHMTETTATSEPLVDSEPVTSSEPEPEPSSNPEQALDSENEPEPETEPEPEVESTPESGLQPDAEEIPVSELEVEHKSGIETDLGHMFQSELSPEPNNKPDSDTEVTPDTDDSMPNESVPAEPESEPVSEAEENYTPEPGSVMETGNESESESTDEPNVQSKTDTEREPGSESGPSEEPTQASKTNEEDNKADTSGTVTGESQLETGMEGSETPSEEQPTEQTTVEPTTRRPLRPLGFFSILDLLTGRRPGGIPNRIAPRIPPRIAPRIPPGGPAPAAPSSSAESTPSEMSESGSETDIPDAPSPLPAESENEQPIEDNSAPTPGDLEAEEGIAGDSETTATNTEAEVATPDKIVPVSEPAPTAAPEPEPTTTTTTTTLRPVPTTPKERLALDVLQSAEFEEHELPPALPNLRIIPFVAADAVVNRYPDELSVEAISSRFGLTAADPPPQQDTRAPPDWCPVDGRLYRHGQMVYRPEEPCRTCRCYRGRVLCQSTECPPVPTGCRVRNRRGFCCPEIVCEEEEEETAEVEEEVTKELAELANAGPPLAPINREPDYTSPRPDFTTSRPLPPDTLPRRRIRPKPVRLSDALASTTTEEPSRRPVLALDSLAFTRGGPAPIASGEDSEEMTLTGDKPSRRPILPLFARPDLSSYRPAPRPRPRPTFPTTTTEPPTTPSPTTTTTTSGPPAFPFATQPTPPPPTPSTTTTTTTTTTAAPPTKRPSIPPPERVTKRPAPAPQVTKRPLPPPFEETNDLATGGDPFSLFGALKLSGCNIFGRMYRLNTVIRELSDDCTVCRCTAAGVNCSPTDC